jgi:hypothetical protein
MVRRLCVLLLGAGLALSQEGRDDEGITIDEVPAASPGQRTTPFPAREPGKNVATVAIKSKVYTLTLPEDWVLAEEENPEAELVWEVLLPGSTKRATLELLREDVGDPRSSPYYQAEWTLEDQPEARTEVKLEPCPRLVVSRSVNGSDRIEAYFYRSIRNNSYCFHLSCAAADFPQAEPDMLAAVGTFSAEVERWPPIPKGYGLSTHGAWLVACAPDVKAPTDPVLKTLKEQEQRFRRDHGALPTTDTPIVVLVLASKGAFWAVGPDSEGDETDVAGEPWKRRILVVPFAKDDVKRQGWLAFEAQQVLWTAKYGDIRPGWIYAGEAFAARAEIRAGKPLPDLAQEFTTWASGRTFHRVEELEKLGDTDADAYFKECFFYVAALREGRYKKDYRAFLDDLSRTCDALGAYARHLAPIDQDDLRSSTQQFISTRAKPEKPN